MNKLVSLTWLLWALRSFLSFTLHYITNFPCKIYDDLFQSPVTKLQLEIHNSPFQLQIRFYNSRNYDQLAYTLKYALPIAHGHSFFSHLGYHKKLLSSQFFMILVQY